MPVERKLTNGTPCTCILKGFFAQNLLDSGFVSRAGEQPRDSGFGGGDCGERTGRLNDIVMANSKHAHQVELINAMLVAGLYPNIAAMRCNHRRLRGCFTDEDGAVSVHPSSLLASYSGDKQTCAPH
jgi:hypothetical protein